MSGFFLKPRGGGGGGGGGGGSEIWKYERWRPTSAHINVLTDLYQSGLLNPNKYQVQKITSQLRFYGKIEDKNVHYWFQNRKAREKQRRFREINFEENFAEMSQVPQPEKELETLQLFPMHSFQESELGKERFFAYHSPTLLQHAETEKERSDLDLQLSL